LALLVVACTHVAISDEGFDGERERARATAERIERDWPLAGAGPAAAGIREVGKRLAAAAGPVSFRWRFTVIRDRSANAFAIGDGRIYINEGAMRVSRNEAELAAILAHEMGHQLAGHLRAEPRPRSRGFFSDLATLFGGSDSASPARTVGGVTQKLDLAKELEADRISLRLLADAGYDPQAALSIARRLHEAGSGGGSHFGDDQRIVALETLLRETPAGGHLDSEKFQRLKRQLE
jgi:predicted Zn-dependent protease